MKASLQVCNYGNLLSFFPESERKENPSLRYMVLYTAIQGMWYMYIVCYNVICGIWYKLIQHKTCY